VAGDSVVNGGDPAKAAAQFAQDVSKAVGADKVKTG
jgi:multiple sugar transport system substrate-binding protein